MAAEGLTISTGMSPANNILRTELVRTKRYYPLTSEVPAYADEDIDQTIAGVRKVWAHPVD